MFLYSCTKYEYGISLTLRLHYVTQYGQSLCVCGHYKETEIDEGQLQDWVDFECKLEWKRGNIWEGDLNFPGTQLELCYWYNIVENGDNVSIIRSEKYECELRRMRLQVNKVDDRMNFLKKTQKNNYEYEKNDNTFIKTKCTLINDKDDINNDVDNSFNDIINQKDDINPLKDDHKQLEEPWDVKFEIQDYWGKVSDKFLISKEYPRLEDPYSTISD